MKHDITYEKADILRLVANELKAKGLAVEDGTSITYKGALKVKLSVVVAPPETEVPTKATRTVLAPEAGGDIRPKPVPEETMEDVLAASRGIGGATRFPTPAERRVK